MRIDIKGYGPERGKNAKCTSEQCGTLTFRADSEVDAVQLAALATAWCHKSGKAGNSITKFREKALLEYCKKHNLTIGKSK